MININDSMVFRLNRGRSPGEIKLLNLEWAVITQLDGQKTVGKISDSLSLSLKEREEIFRKLINAGLLELVSQEKKQGSIDPKILDTIRHQLTTLVGPVADIIYEETFKEIRKPATEFSMNDLAILIDLLTSQIGSNDKKEQFQKNVYDQVKSKILG
ncbi:MAG: hypothetical protein WAN36_14190 [Calditrichia bacterium]